jgi:hypothetical protein
MAAVIRSQVAGPGAVTIRREFVGVCGAFQHRLLAVARKHEVRDPPNVDFRDHAAKPIR